MNPLRTILALVLLLLCPAAFGGRSGQTPIAGGLELVVTSQFTGPVLTIRDPGAQDNKYGFEGGRVLRIAGIWHLFTSEMTGDPHWVKMRLAHWTSPDRIHWTRQATLFESTGDFTGDDPRAALWSPMPVFDPERDRWNLFYVAYRAAPDTDTAWLTNHKGRIWRAVSQQAGQDGIGGPYKDAGVVMQPGEDSDPWEGLQGTDSFFPYLVGHQWYAFYGSAHTETLPIPLWQVGLATAPHLAGPWIRCTSLNPLPVEPRFIENPVVSRLSDGTYIAVYDNHRPNAIGYTVSDDGIHWSPGRVLVVQSGNHVWASEVRTPLGLVEDGRNTFTLFYTANQKVPGGATDTWGVTLTPGALGFVEVRLQRRTPPVAEAGGQSSARRSDGRAGSARAALRVPASRASLSAPASVTLVTFQHPKFSLLPADGATDSLSANFGRFQGYRSACRSFSARHRAGTAPSYHRIQEPREFNGSINWGLL